MKPTQLNTENNSLALQLVSSTNTVQLLEAFPRLSASVSVTPLRTLVRTTPQCLRALAAVIRNSSVMRLSTLSDIAVTDKLETRGRFVIKYSFLSTVYNFRFVVSIYADETTNLYSLASPFFHKKRIFASASWLERECWDLFGTYFSEHGDLRRILTDYGFTGHPLRKDFPLTGFSELVYNDAEGRVIAEPVELSQEFRVFHI